MHKPKPTHILALLAALAPFTSPAAAQEPGPRITFDKYHSFEEIVIYLHRVAAKHPRLVTLVEFGRSRLDRPLLALEINNPDRGPAEDKPGFYSDGNIHGGEVLSGEGMLYLIELLLTGYGEDEEITNLIDGSALYLVPIVNPDGRVISVATPENHRWNARPLDEDGDGRVDEDSPEDLDGDGRILQMRIPDPEGRFVIDEADPRRMVRARGGAGPRYRVLSEGLDDDGDGRFNEDPVGGVDLNRNFPVNWSPTQYASGPYPLSEPESRALVDYITARPNIAAIHTFHTSGGLILRFPTLADQDWDFPEEDLLLYREIAAEGVAITGYENMAYEKKTIVDLMSPGHGVFNDWASKVFGVLAITTEMWKHPFGGPGLFEWNDRVLDGKGFIAWKPFEHPELGPVELGGWDRWSISSPPPRLIEPELERNARWVLTFARRLPLLGCSSTTAVHEIGSDDYTIKTRVENWGWMPTATTWAEREWHTAKPVKVTLTLSGAELLEGRAVQSLGVLPGAREGGPDPWRDLVWRVRTTAGDQPAKVTITVSSEKAGTVRLPIELR